MSAEQISGALTEAVGDGKTISPGLRNGYETCAQEGSFISERADFHREVEERLRTTEEKYQNIFENSIMGIFQVSLEGRFLSANPAAAHVLGYKSPEEMIATVANASDLLCLTPERRDEYACFGNDQGFVHGFEVQARRKDGNLCSISLNARAVRSEDERVLHYDGVFQDISERKRLEFQLLQSQKMEAIGTLAGGVAHDFNNLLMGIQGYTSLMLYNLPQNNPHYERLKSIEQLVRSGADLTKQLLGFARGGRYQVKVSDLNEVLQNVSAMFVRTKKEITFHEKYEAGLYPVDIDRSQIEQAFLNLYVNAWQAMPGGGHLYVETQNVVLDKNYSKSYSVQPGRYVKVSVTDTGVGMDERTMKRIFEPFFTTKEMGRGTGLGLASVYGIVQGHKGFINVYSQVGHGTTFSMYLPASRKAFKKVEDRPEELKTGTETILLVDDEETIIDVSKEILETLGYRVLVAMSGQEAVDIYRRKAQEIDLVVLDMIMPDMEGGKTFDMLREIDSTVSVILSSGYSLNGEAESIIERGCKAFIQKPFNIYSLSKQVRAVLDQGVVL